MTKDEFLRERNFSERRLTALDSETILGCETVACFIDEAQEVTKEEIIRMSEGWIKPPGRT
jgi:hypothetical protein